MKKYDINEEVCAKINGIFYRGKIVSIVPNTDQSRYVVLINRIGEHIVNEIDITRC